MTFNFDEFIIPEKEIGPLSATVVAYSGALNFLKECRATYQINGFSHAVLYWDEEERVMGVELKHEECPNAFEIGSGASIRCKQFFEAHRICFDESYRVAVEKDKETGYLVVKGFRFAKAKKD